MKKTILTAFLVFVVVISTFYLLKNQEPTADVVKDKLTVTKVIDGDTLVLSDDNHVRLIGINTPEKNQFYYQEAKDKLTSLVEGKEISLVKDKTNNDKYGRLLRYVYLDDVFINEVMVEEGYAEAIEYKPNLAHQDELETAELEAKQQHLGLWKDYKESLSDCQKLGCPVNTQFVGSKNSNYFYDCNCVYASRIKKDNLICFSNKEDAINASYKQLRGC
ncbi:MAG TPA: thermonuclease family protein [Candidatus Nanoarchaeia archaeon]|nr:thermonuclease family protein [Candidatus Nanoarchaeia archaeon]